jgi:hypothetical protein
MKVIQHEQIRRALGAKMAFGPSVDRIRSANSVPIQQDFKPVGGQNRVARQGESPEINPTSFSKGPSEGSFCR